MDENNIFLTIKLAVTAAIGAFSSAFGWLGWLVLVWVLCMVADYITGSAAAAHSGEWSSAAARSGIWHKAGMMVVVAVSLGLDILIGMILSNIPAITLPFEYSVLVCTHRAGQHFGKCRSHGCAYACLFAQNAGGAARSRRKHRR